MEFVKLLEAGKFYILHENRHSKFLSHWAVIDLLVLYKAPWTSYPNQGYSFTTLAARTSKACRYIPPDKFDIVFSALKWQWNVEPIERDMLPCYLDWQYVLPAFDKILKGELV